MIKNTYGESLIGIIIGVFILSFILLGVTNLLINSKNIIETYENKKTVSILKKNTINIIKTINSDQVKETEIFYLNKNNTTKEFEIFTGSTNAIYKYIDQYGNKIDNLENFDKKIYSRTLWLERDDTSIGKNHQIIKVSIKRLIKQ